MRLLRADVGDNKDNNVSDNITDNTLSDVLIRLERLEHLFNNKTDNNDDSQPFGEDWVNLVTIAAQLEVLPKSISGAASKRGRDIGNDTIKLEIANRTIHKKGSGLKALYQLKN